MNFDSFFPFSARLPLHSELRFAIVYAFELHEMQLSARDATKKKTGVPDENAENTTTSSTVLNILKSG